MYQTNDSIGPYTLRRKLGKGAFGVVWLAEKRTAFGQFEYALKMAVRDEIDLQAVAEEVSTWKDAKGHPNVLPLIDADVYGEDFVIVSEFAPDGSLQTWLNAHGGRAPDIAAAVRMTNGILDGLIHLHAKRIIHRDLKPDNILLRGTTPMLADFGLARVLKTTQSSNIAGTVQYMSPEALDNQRTVQVDVWSVGVMLYQMLAGRLPFAGQGPPLMLSILRDEPAPLPASVPAGLREIVARALEKDLARRQATAQVMREELRAFTEQQAEARRQAAQKATETDLARAAAEAAERQRQEAARLRAEEEQRAQAEAERQQQQQAAARRQAGKEREEREAARQRAQAAEREAAKQRPAQEASPPEMAARRWPRWAAGIATTVLSVSFLGYSLSGKFTNTTTTNPTADNTAGQTTTPAKTGVTFDPATATATLSGNVKMEFVQIPTGSFMMGSPGGETGRFDDEGPQHQVTISREFYLGRYEVTQAQWQAVMGNNPSKFSGCAECPVEQVSYEEAQQFIQKINSPMSGGKYRLPTEAEWEYAARAGTTGPYGGNLDEMGWYDQNSGSKTHPVGQKKANKFGLYDMHGNVYEWCADWYGPYSGGSVTDPQGPASGSSRVLRGGSWNATARFARSAFRGSLSPGLRDRDLGFRLLRE